MLKMNVPLYDTKQAAYCFFQMFKRQVMSMSYEQSRADLYLYFALECNTFIVLVAWVDGVVIFGSPVMVKKA